MIVDKLLDPFNRSIKSVGYRNLYGERVVIILNIALRGKDEVFFIMKHAILEGGNLLLKYVDCIKMFLLSLLNSGR